MFALAALRLLLPAIVPSWRFFDMVSASPRLDYALLSMPDDQDGQWQEFRPRPAILTPATMLRRMVWNPRWNESLFLVSLAERLMSNGASEDTIAHSQRELLMRVARHLDRLDACGRGAHLQIRLRFLRRAGATEQIDGDIVFLSSPWPIADLLTP